MVILIPKRSNNMTGTRFCKNRKKNPEEVNKKVRVGRFFQVVSGYLKHTFFFRPNDSKNTGTMKQ